MSNTSTVWEHFIEVQNSKGQKLGKCNYCSDRNRTLYVKNGTSNTWNHLKIQHQNRFSGSSLLVQIILKFHDTSSRGSYYHLLHLMCWSSVSILFSFLWILVKQQHNCRSQNLLLCFVVGNNRHP